MTKNTTQSKTKKSVNTKQKKTTNLYRSLPKKYYKSESEVYSHILTLRGVGVGLTFIILMTLFAMSKMPDDILLHNAPNLESGSTRKIKEIPQYSLYSTAYYLWQQINTTDDLSKGYKFNVEVRYQNYLAPEFANQLMFIHERDKADKLGISRELKEVEAASWSDDRVFQLTPDKWVVYIDADITERLKGQLVRNVKVRYPLIIERADFNPTTNPTGMKIVGYYTNPSRL